MYKLQMDANNTADDFETTLVYRLELYAIEIQQDNNIVYVCR